MNYVISCGTEQAQIIDKLKSAGAKVIQSSSGLVCKSEQSLASIEKVLEGQNCRVEEISDASKESPDVQKFLNS